MSYLPPFARMRQIRKAAAPRTPSVTDMGGTNPQNVEEALAAVEPEPVFVVEIPDPIDDIEPPMADPVDDIEPPMADPVAADPIKIDASMKKAELLALAEALGVEADDTMTKSQIIAVLRAATGQ